MDSKSMKTWAGSLAEDQAVNPAISANRMLVSGKRSAILEGEKT
jgi:hypothetical protein